jgi:hypothetical protein
MSSIVVAAPIVIPFNEMVSDLYEDISKLVIEYLDGPREYKRDAFRSKILIPSIHPLQVDQCRIPAVTLSNLITAFHRCQRDISNRVRALFHTMIRSSKSDLRVDFRLQRRYGATTAIHHLVAYLSCQTICSEVLLIHTSGKRSGVVMYEALLQMIPYLQSRHARGLLLYRNGLRVYINPGYDEPIEATFVIYDSTCDADPRLEERSRNSKVLALGSLLNPVSSWPDVACSIVLNGEVGMIDVKVGENHRKIVVENSNYDRDD